MSLQEYFEQPDTPDRNSPAGILMLAVFEKFPGIAFEQAREKAYALLDCAAGKRVYRIRPVLTEEEQAARRDAVRARFGHGRKPETVSVTA